MQRKTHIYILVRGDLSPEQVAVQSSHAAFESARKFPSNISNPHLVLLTVDSEEDLVVWDEYLKDLDVDHTCFFEPDVDGYTALATSVLPRSIGRTFRKLPLYRWKGE